MHWLHLTAGAAYAQAIPVNPTYKGWLASSDPTMTFLFEAPEAKATLLFIPGGEGRRGVKPEWTASHGYFTSYHFNVMLRSLSDPTVTSGQFNVVIFDSPADLPTANHWSAARESTDHLSRVEDVVRHYKERFGKPLWVMGHSMGSISITEFYKRLQDKRTESLVAGLILSGGENGTSFNYETTKLPVLVLHHENDECVGNTPGGSILGCAKPATRPQNWFSTSPAHDHPTATTRVARVTTCISERALMLPKCWINS